MTWYEIHINGHYFRRWPYRELAEADREELIERWKVLGVEKPAVVEIKERVDNDGENH